MVVWEILPIKQLIPLSEMQNSHVPSLRNWLMMLIIHYFLLLKQLSKNIV